MSRLAFVLGAPGQIGYATVRTLAESGWRVRAAARRADLAALWPAELGVEPVVVNRASIDALARGLGDGCDVFVDCVAYTAEHGRQLLSLADRIGSAIVISSLAVYADADGRGFDEDDDDEDGGAWPALHVGFTEEQPTIAPSAHSYGGRKVALEQTLLAAGTLPVTIMRPGAIYGPHSHYPREWYFVKRALDRRPYRLLCRRGASRFHTMAAVNLAHMIRLAAELPGTRVLNAGDPDAPTVREIGAAISAVLGHEAEEVLIDGDPPPGGIGDTPWSAPGPVVMDTSKAAADLGYRPLAGYSEAVEQAVRWMVDSVGNRDWRDVFPYFYANQGEEAFDYDAEDEWLAMRRHPAG